MTPRDPASNQPQMRHKRASNQAQIRRPPQPMFPLLLGNNLPSPPSKEIKDLRDLKANEGPRDLRASEVYQVRLVRPDPKEKLGRLDPLVRSDRWELLDPGG